MQAGRREFIQVLVFFGAAGALAACGGGADDGGGDQNPGPGGGQNAGNCTANGAKAQSITANHGHRLMVPAADFAAGVTQTYDITGTSDHAHTIELTGAQLATLAGGSTVTVTSSGEAGHTHGVTCVCA